MLQFFVALDVWLCLPFWWIWGWLALEALRGTLVSPDEVQKSSGLIVLVCAR